MTLKFKNPPINELVIGVFFNPPLATLRSEHIGFFWSRIHERFPRSSNNIPIGGAVDIIATGEVFPMPRFWFRSEDESTLVQIQKNAFLLNWKKCKGEYPHFDNVKAEFDSLYDEFKAFLKEYIGQEDIYVESCEFSYINFVEESELYSGISDIKKVIPSFNFPDSGIADIKDVLSRTIYEPADNIRLGVTLQNKVVTGEKRNILYYEIKATGKLAKASKSEADSWFVQAHKITGDCFLKMTSKEAHKLWGLEEK